MQAADQHASGGAGDSPVPLNSGWPVTVIGTCVVPPVPEYTPQL